MKRIILSLALLFVTTLAFSQAKKPTIMVVPSDVWMSQNGYMDEVEMMGVMTPVPNYQRALMGDADLLIAITKIGELMAERGFPLKVLDSELKRIQTELTEENYMAEEEGGIAESSLERLRRVANADIWMSLTWVVNTMGPKRSVTFNLQGIDAYTNKQIAAASGTGNQSFSTEVPVLLSEAVVMHIDQFNAQLQSHFDDLFANGREVGLTLRRTNSSDVNFDSEVGDDILSFMIEDWMAENCVGGKFSTAEVSTNRMRFEQVRIPLVLESGRTIDTRTWARDLQRFLMTKCKLRVKLTTKGLGQAELEIQGRRE